MGFVIAAYGIVAVVVGGYALLLSRRRRALIRSLEGG